MPKLQFMLPLTYGFFSFFGFFGFVNFTGMALLICLPMDIVFS